MENQNKVSSRIIELEVSIKLLEYLKRKNIIDEGMYHYCINKFINRIEVEKLKQDDEYRNDLNNYRLLT